MNKKNYQEPFAILSNNVDLFMQQIRSKKSNLKATSKWTVKDVLCHIVFWHENYAANYRALALNHEPPLLEGPGYKLNLQGVTLLRKYSLATLALRLQKAQQCLYTSIVEKKVSKMTYKKGSRAYTTQEFLHLVARHFVTHTTQVRRAK